MKTTEARSHGARFVHPDGSVFRCLRGFVVAVILGLLPLACGGGGGGGGSSPPPSPSPTPQDPCAAGVLAGVEADDLPPTPPNPAKRGQFRDPHPDRAFVEAVAIHNIALARGLFQPPALQQPADEDIGELAVLQDQGELVLIANVLDIHGIGVRFSRNASGGYDISRTSGAFQTPLGSALNLGDDDTREVALGFTFPFYAKSHGSVFMNSDGNLTFEESDTETSARDLARHLTGPPRLSVFFTDLDPSQGGRVLVHSAGDRFTATWCGVRAFESVRTTTAQVSVLPDGAIEMRWGSEVNIPDVIVGLSPGRTGDLIIADLRNVSPASVGAQAVAERFSLEGELDLVAVARKFYASHGDLYDQLVMWSDQRLLGQGSFARYVPVANEIRGLGLRLFDSARDFGSGGRLRGMLHMDAPSKYPDDPTAKFLGENNTLSILGQETGHRWLARLEFLDHNRQRSAALLGRDRAHWSFFFDSDASALEGNDIEDLGGGSFRTIAAVERFSRLDQYAMGLIGAAEIPRFFYVESPTNVNPHALPDFGPRIGTTFNGTRRDVLIQDVIAAIGERVPSAVDTPKVTRQAWIFVVSRGRAAESRELEKLDRARRDWEAFFARAADGRGRVETRLRPPT